MKNPVSGKLLLGCALLLAVVACLESCRRRRDEAIADFLAQQTLQLDTIINNWTWQMSSEGLSGGIILTPETEGYHRELSFLREGEFIEVTDDIISFTTYFRVDTTQRWKKNIPMYRIEYFEGREAQNFTFHLMDGKVYLQLFDLNCFDCIGAHTYQLKQ